MQRLERSEMKVTFIRNKGRILPITYFLNSQIFVTGHYNQLVFQINSFNEVIVNYIYFFNCGTTSI
jgi:hypothetical protein